MNGSVRAIWTDYGGVLTPPVSETLSRFCTQLGVTTSALLAAMRQVANDCGAGDDIMAPLDTPLLSQDDWERQVERALHEQTGDRVDLSNYPARWFADRAVNDPWLNFLRRLRGTGVFVGMLSNMPPAWDPYWRKAIPPSELFGHVVLSYQAGCRKPEQEIFQLAAKLAGMVPSECLLIDDLPQNCEGARKAGWKAIEFTDSAQTAAAVNALLATPERG